MFIYARFEELIEELGIKKTFIAEKLGKSPSICQDWKRGKSQPNADQLKIVADILDTTPEYLTGETDTKEKPVPTEDELDNILINLLKELTPEESAKAASFVQGLLAAREA